MLSVHCPVSSQLLASLRRTAEGDEGAWNGGRVVIFLYSHIFFSELQHSQQFSAESPMLLFPACPISLCGSEVIVFSFYGLRAGHMLS